MKHSIGASIELDGDSEQIVLLAKFAVMMAELIDPGAAIEIRAVAWKTDQVYYNEPVPGNLGETIFRHPEPIDRLAHYADDDDPRR